MKDTSFIRTKDYNKKKYLINVIKDMYKRYMNKEISKEVLQIIIDNTMIMKKYEVFIMNKEEDFIQHIYNGYIRELSESTDIIKRKTVIPIIGIVKPGYNQNGKILYNPEILMGDLLVVMNIICNRGVSYEESIYSETYEIIIYEKGGSK